ncbi:phosphoribosylformylglycinamidine synthase subunit PurS [Candidatus Pelagibacter sp.]|nr:phosphoribosylformylglycinamidine synthase subunit PurS [Candidatus Pelagibacter sp.]
MDTKENDKIKAEAKVEEMCKKLLANLVIEDFKIIGSQ